MIKEVDVKKIVDKWDPIELLAMHAPPDEYDSESKKVYNLAVANPTISTLELGEIIYTVFIKSFGNDVFTNTLEECKEVANDILNFKSKISE